MKAFPEWDGFTRDPPLIGKGEHPGRRGRKHVWGTGEGSLAFVLYREKTEVIFLSFRVWGRKKVFGREGDSSSGKGSEKKKKKSKILFFKGTKERPALRVEEGKSLWRGDLLLSKETLLNEREKFPAFTKEVTEVLGGDIFQLEKISEDSFFTAWGVWKGRILLNRQTRKIHRKKKTF